MTCAFGAAGADQPVLGRSGVREMVRTFGVLGSPRARRFGSARSRSPLSARGALETTMRQMLLTVLAVALFVLGCKGDPDSDSSPPDSGGSSDTRDAGASDGSAGGEKPDAGARRPDSGAGQPDTEAGKQDAGVARPDVGVGTPDAGAGDPDSGEGRHDAGGTNPDTGSLPPITDPSSKGPFAAKTIQNTGPDGQYTVYLPEELAPGGVLSPVVTWGNGGMTTPALYPLLPHLSSHGFVVVASNNTMVTGDLVRAGLDWMEKQSEDASSPFYHKVDVHHAAGVGYSNGGLATLATADDPRYQTIIIISGANVRADSRAANMPKLRTSIAYLCTDDQASKGNCAADYAAVKVPAFFGVMKGSTHTSVLPGLLGEGKYVPLLNAATTAWLRWQIAADRTFESTFAGTDCRLCTDSNWTVEPQKNW